MTMTSRTQHYDYRVAWRGGEAWHLDPLGNLPGIHEIPRDLATPKFYECADLAANGVSIIVGEVGDGRRSFLKWLEGWHPLSMSDTPNLEFFAAQATAGNHRFYLDLSHIDRPLGQASDSLHHFLAALAGVSQRDFHGRSIALVVLARWLTTVQNSYDGSSLLARGKLYRLPHFDPPELRDWVKDLAGRKQWTLADAKLEAHASLLKRLVGGQPKLTDVLMQHVYEVCSEAAQFEPALRERADRLRKFPPECVTEWRIHLRALLKRPETRRLVRAYVTGSTKQLTGGELDSDDLALFLAGWVGAQPDGTGGIRSEVHRTWAREEL